MAREASRCCPVRLRRVGRRCAGLLIGRYAKASRLPRIRVRRIAQSFGSGVTALAGYCSLGANSDALSACKRMLNAQSVYAPDQPIALRAGGAALGRRLFRLLPEDQYDRGPVSAGSWTVVADARLDDRRGLADALGLGFADASLMSDATLVARAVDRWGGEAADRLIGDFAFAAWDDDADTLLLARDFIGHRPLHFHQGDGFVAFASMAKGLHALAEVPRAPDENHIRSFLGLLPHHGTGTFFARIERVPPGHLAIITRRGTKVRRYWHPDRNLLRLKTSGEYQEAVRAALDNAVAAQLRSTPTLVASHLSGGLDSSAVSATAARRLASTGLRLVAYTSVPGENFTGHTRHGRFIDEGPHAAAVTALHPNIEHVLVRAMADASLDSMDRSAFLNERPTLNLCNATWMNAILDDAKGRGVQVLLTGQFGNMSFSFNGFQHLSALFARGRLLKLAVEALALRRGGIRLVSSAGHAVGPFVPRRLWLAINRLMGRGLDVNDYAMLGASAADKVRRDATGSGRDSANRPNLDPFEARLSAMARMDPGTANKGTLGGWGVDVRDPSADRRLVELCLRIPMDQYLRGGRTRALARDAFADRLPQVVTQETRKGLQAADWSVGFSKSLENAATEIERLAALPAASDLLDTDRMRSLVADWPKHGLTDSATTNLYRYALLRGVSAGHFLRHSAGAN